MFTPKWQILVVAVCLCIFEIRAHVAAAFETNEGYYVIQDFHFHSGETLPQLRLHYSTLGQPLRDAQGHVSNAVLILHGTGGSDHQFLQGEFADVLFVSGGLLDPAKYFIILPDGIGNGRSAKPSDGLHARFPQYDYGDMVQAQHDLVVQGLGIDHLRLVMGTSMGCMHAFIWGETYPDFMDALMPLACLPIPIAGRNRIWRKMIVDAIRSDPAWVGGEYQTEPWEALRTAADLLLLAGSAPHQMQKAYPTREAADAYLDEYVSKAFARLDANDLVYQLDASSDYDASIEIGRIIARVMWVNSADDFMNPPELGLAEQEAKKLKNGSFVLIPVSNETYGHVTHSRAVVWKDYLQELLSTAPFSHSTPVQ
jgi:homoserine O-acetyltransferase/O-succinyltransferase